MKDMVQIPGGVFAMGSDDFSIPRKAIKQLEDVA